MVNLPTLYQKRVCLSFNRAIKLFIALFFIVLSVGCSSDVSQYPGSKIIEYDSTKDAAYYFYMMQKTNGMSKTDLYLMAIKALLKEKRFAEAKQHIAALPLFLNDTQKNEKTLILADMAIRQQQPVDLTMINDNQFTELQRRYFYRIKLLKDKQNKDVNAIVRDYIQLETIGTPQARHQVIDKTWRYFNKLSDDQLKRIIVFSHEMTLKGWVDLYYAYRNSLHVDNDGNALETENDQAKRIAVVVSEWQMQYPTHPAALYLPRDLNGDEDQVIAAKKGIKGKKVALLLPLEGASKIFGEVVRAGYIEASRFYPDDALQDIIVLDTASSPMSHLINEAKAQGAELIVGPLLKDDVTKIIQLNAHIPILALNKPKQQNGVWFSDTATKVCYFSLSPEDEVSDAARHIMAQGKRKPLIITANTPLGRRVVHAFDHEWQSLHGNSLYVQYFESVDALKEAMNKGIGLLVEGEPVNPQQSLASLPDEENKDANDEHDADSKGDSEDIDAIYIFSTQNELEFIKPMLEMQHPDELDSEDEKSLLMKKSNPSLPPIYASSRSQSANGSPDYRYEMENVQFSDIPLLVAKNPVLAELPKSIQRDYFLARLYAMGVDAWRLANRFNQLTDGTGIALNGLTGTMRVSPYCEINRQLPWRIYKKGKVRLVR